MSISESTYQNDQPMPLFHSFKTITEINEKYHEDPKLVTEIQDKIHWRNRLVNIFNLKDFTVKTAKVPPNINKNADYASILGKNKMISVGGVINLYSRQDYMHIFDMDENYATYKKINMNPPMTHTVFQENTVYLISDNGVAKYVDDKQKYYTLPDFNFSVGCLAISHIMFGRYLYVIMFRRNSGNPASIKICRLDILDEEAGWTFLGEYEGSTQNDTYKLTNKMADFSYGFHAFNNLGICVEITPPEIYENIERNGTLKILSRYYDSDMSFIWKGKVFYEFTRPKKPRFKICDLKTRNEKIINTNGIKKIIRNIKKRESKIRRPGRPRKIKKIE